MIPILETHKFSEWWKHFGFISYPIRRPDGIFDIKTWNRWSVTSQLLQSLNFIYTIALFRGLVNDLRPEASIMEYWMYVSVCLVESLSLLINLVLRNLYNGDKAILINTLMDISEIQELNIKLDHYNLRRIYKKIVIIGSIIVCYYCIHTATSLFVTNNVLGIFGQLSLTYAMLIRLFIGVQYVIFLLIIKHILHALNLRLLALDKPGISQKNLTKTIRTLSGVYAKAFKCVNIVNSIIASSFLVRFGAIFAIMVLQIFNMPTMLYVPAFDDVDYLKYLLILTSFLNTIIICMIEMGAYTLTAEAYMEEVKNYFINCDYNRYQFDKFAHTTLLCRGMKLSYLSTLKIDDIIAVNNR